jgi:2-keto-3-deoxy-L-rhamnonate aldolase RhmA
MFDPDAPRLKSRLIGGPPIGAFWFSLGAPVLVEIALSRGAEAVVIDMQHGLWDRAGLEAEVGLCPPEAPCLVRTEDDSDAAIARALDAGAEGVIVPMVETAAQAARVATAAHYPPQGRRSAGGIRTLADFPRYRAGAASGVTVGVMIETAAGVAATEAIAAAPLVDFVFIGTGDLGLAIGGGTAALDDACGAILAACRNAGRPCGVFAMDVGSALRRAGQGYALTVVCADVISASAGFSDAASAWNVPAAG